MEKKCPLCKKTKPVSEFYNNKSRKDGKEWCCKACLQEKRHKAYLERRDMEIKKARQWQMNNPIKVAGYKRKFNQANPMASRYYNLKAKNREKFQISIEDFYSWYDHEPKECFYCGIPSDLLKNVKQYTHKKSNNLFTIDRKEPNGNYEIENMVLACPLCNLIKSNLFTASEMWEIAQRYIKPKWQQIAGVALTPLIPPVKLRRLSKEEMNLLPKVLTVKAISLPSVVSRATIDKVKEINPGREFEEV